MRIKSKIADLPNRVKASIAFAVCSMLQQGIQLFTIPIFTRMLSTAEYGQYSLYQSWLGIFSIFCTLNLSSGVFNNGMLKYPNNRDDYISSMQGLSTTVTLFFFLVFVIWQQGWAKLIGLPVIVIYAAFIELIFRPALSFWSGKQRYEYKYVALVFVTLLMSVANPIIGIIAVRHSVEKGIARILSVASINIVIGIYFYFYNIKKSKCLFQKEYWRFALMFNLPLIPHYLSQIVLAQSDRVMIGNMFNTSDVAVYSVAYNIGMIMSIITTSINSSFVPWTYENMKLGNYDRIKTLSNGLVIVIAVVALIPVMFGVEAVRILGTKEYLEAVWVIPPVAISYFLIFIYSLFGNVEFFYEKSKFVMIASVSAAFLNIILNYIFMNYFGYIAAGYTTLACYIEMVAAHYLFMRRITKEKLQRNSIYDDKFILIITILLTAAAALFMVTYNYTVIRYTLICIVLIIVFLKRDFFIGQIKEVRKR